MLEFVLILAAVLALAGYGMNRRKHRVFHEYNHQENLICTVTFYDRSITLPLIESYFKQEYIQVRGLKQEIKRAGDQDLFTNTYELLVPQHVENGALVGHLSAISTVQSVQIRPK